MIGRFFAKYWRETLIVVMVIGVSVAWSQDHKSLIKAYDSAVVSYEAQLEALNESHQRELERKDQALQEYQAKMEEIEKELDVMASYDDKLEMLNKYFSESVNKEILKD